MQDIVQIMYMLQYRVATNYVWHQQTFVGTIILQTSTLTQPK